MAAMLLVVPGTAMAMPKAEAAVAPDCFIGATSPDKVNGQIRATGSMTCSRAYTLVLVVCIQINAGAGFVPLYCGTPATKTGTSVNTTATGPCPTSALYRTHVIGQVYSSQGVLEFQGTLLTGAVAIDCPPLP